MLLPQPLAAQLLGNGLAGGALLGEAGTGQGGGIGGVVNDPGGFEPIEDLLSDMRGDLLALQELGQRGARGGRAAEAPQDDIPCRLDLLLVLVSSELRHLRNRRRPRRRRSRYPTRHRSSWCVS